MTSAYWVRVGNEVRGPFAPEKIFEATLVGKLSRDTLISADRTNWRSIGDEWGTLLDEPGGTADAAPMPRAAPVEGARPAAARAPTPPAGRDRARVGARGRERADADPSHGRDRAHVRQGAERGPTRSRPGRPSTALLASAAVGVLALVVGAVLLAAKATGPAAPPPRGGAAGIADLARKARPSGPQTPQQLMRRAEGSVALLRDASTSGTGFMAGEGILVTCAHVVRPMVPALMQVIFPSVGRTEYPVTRILYIDDVRDIAVLAIRTDQPALDLPDSSATPVRGEEVLVIGNPGVGPELIVENAVARGLMGPEVVIDGSAFFQLSASVNPGNSGGPVLRSDGTLVGMVSKKANHQEGMAFAVPVRLIGTALRVAKGQSPDVVAKLNEDQLAQALFRQLDMAGEAYCMALGAYLVGLRRAVAAGAETIEDLQPYLPDLKSELRRVESTSAKHLTTFVKVLESTRWRDPSIGEDLSSLQDVLNTLRTRAHVNDAIGVLVNLERTDAAVTDFRKISKRLRMRLHIPESDD